MENAPIAQIGLKVADSTQKTARINQFRESRVDLSNEQGAVVTFKDFYGESHTARLVNISRFGVRVELANTGVPLQMGSSLAEGKVILDNTVVYSGVMIVANATSAAANMSSYGLTLESGQIDIEQVRAIIEIVGEKEVIEGARNILRIGDSVRPEFKILCSDLNTLFQDLKSRLALEEIKIRKTEVSDSYKRRLEEHAINVCMSLYVDEIHRIFGMFKKVVDTLSKDESVLHKRYFRANFHPLTMGSPFVNRSFTKPLGYSGDYGLMLMLYNYEDSGGNLFEKFFHRFSCNEPAAIANKNRVEFLSEILLDYYGRTTTDQDFKVTSVACGPAKEMELFVEKVDNSHAAKIDLTMIDQEAEALDWAQKTLRPLVSKKKIKTTYLKEDAVLGIIKDRDFVEALSNSNIIISAGLFDYLSDRVASRLIGALVSRLAPAGVLFVGNVSKENPDRFSMDFFAEWNLMLRGKDDMLALVPQELLDTKKCKVEVISESLGLNLFLKITRI